MATKTGTLRVIEPATEQVLAELQEATVEEADQAVARAKAAYAPWRALHPKDRANLMRRLAAEIEKQAEALARLEARNVGKPISDARGEVGMVVDVFNYYAGAPERLVQHPDVAKVAFTGSTEVGKRIGALAAASIKRVTLELGGKSANIVFADADLEKAAASAPLAVFGNAGQDCCARSRILVERSALDRFMQALEKSIKALRVGDPLDETTEMGPLISADHRAKVASFLDDC